MCEKSDLKGFNNNCKNCNVSFVCLLFFFALGGGGGGGGGGVANADWMCLHFVFDKTFW